MSPLFALVAGLPMGCQSPVVTGPPLTTDPPPLTTDPMAPDRRFVDRTGDLPPLTGFCMDAQPVDVDGDQDLDLVLAIERGENILLLNDGAGQFTDVSDARLPRTRRDSEDIAIGDFNEDGAPDLVFVTEDDRVNELYLNENGTFVDASDQIPVEGVSNAVATLPLNGDGVADLIIGNAGANEAVLGGLPMTADTEARLPAMAEPTQDIEVGDVDGDDDLDIVIANESDNQLWLNDGDGRFIVAEGAIEVRAAPEETREAELGDVDGDDDLDLVFGNIQFLVAGADVANRLLLNDGTGRFTTAPAGALPVDDDDTFDVELVDLDGDDDLDLITANLASLFGDPADRPYRVYENDGEGRFTLATAAFFPSTAVGNGFDIEVADFTGDDVPDVFLCSRGGQDRLLVGVR